MYSIFEELLKYHKVTAYKVAKATGITTSTLTAWKKGEYTPKADKLQKIADYFGVTLAYLMGQTDIKEDFENNPDYYVPGEYLELGMTPEQYYRFKQAEAEDAQREQSLYMTDTNTNTYTDHERKVIKAYRNQPQMQPAVDRILGITKEPVHLMPVAAHNDSQGKEQLELMKEDLDEL